ncbi:hypothetical protein H0H93_001919 [Arthromyces matolae]|nr:hypothetical protein H0H93_001919 [Arthromyces matolae]
MDDISMINPAELDSESRPGLGPSNVPNPQQAHAHSQRFRDWDSIQYLASLGKNGSSRSQTFYNGETLSTRMTALRQAIIYVRDNWGEYPSLMADLHSYIDELTTSSVADGRDHLDLPPYLPIVLNSRKVWNSHSDMILDDENLSVIRLYTSKGGYDHIFRIINQAFRSSNVHEQEKRLRCAVFLIELLNIDLFNYTLHSPRLHNFEGTVYRGVVFSHDQLQDFKDLAALPVADRYWGIPMAMMSASMNKEVALREFAGLDKSLDSTEPQARYPFLWRIHVLGLFPRYLNIYRERFPTSVVSTICAVPIKELSDFAAEDEVLLRGPFFQLVSLREEFFEGHEQPIHVMDLVMLNINRDHPSTMQLSPEEGDKARQLFACLVGLCRTEICRELAMVYGLTDDIAQYEEMYRVASEKLERFGF